MPAADPATELRVPSRNPARGKKRARPVRRSRGEEPSEPAFERAAIPTQREPEQADAERARRPRPEELTPQEQDRVDRAAAFCADTFMDGWESAVTEQALECITPETWNRLFGTHRDQVCKALADLAKSVLDGKQKLHDLVGSVAERLAGDVGLEPVDRAVVRELAKRIPIPVIDEKTVVVARGLQMIGILLCLSEGRPLNECQCFIDLALAETKERVKQILTDAMEDWATRSPALLRT